MYKYEEPKKIVKIFNLKLSP